MNEENKKSAPDKALNRLVLGAVMSILACLVALCSTTFCWFTDSANSSPSTIQTAAQCLLEIVVDESGAELADIENGVTLTGGVTYRVTLTLPKDSSSGYCKMLVGEDVYLSPYLIRHDDDTPKTVTYYVVAEVDTEVKFVVHWGLYSAQASVLADETLQIPQNP